MSQSPHPDQDLRTASEFLMAHLGDPEDAQPCGCFPDPSGLRDAMQRVHDALTAPPRPDHAGGVPSGYADYTPVTIGTGTSPAQAPDKAAEREGGDREARAEIVAASYYNQMMELPEPWPHGKGWAGKPESFKAKVRERIANAIDALAPKPTGTEAGRGVDAEDEADLCMRSARMFIGWPTAFKDRLDKAETNEALVACSEELAGFLKRHREMARAATPTPPVSPSPDSTGPAGAYSPDAALTENPDAGLSNWEIAQEIAALARDGRGITATVAAALDRKDAALTSSAAPVQDDVALYGIIDPDYARVFTQSRCLAWAEGYALMMHGSFTRDLDLIAVPWTDQACEPEHLVNRIAATADLTVAPSSPGMKAHGRLAWTLLFQGFGDPRFVDLSIMPRAALTPSAPITAPIRDDAKTDAIQKQCAHYGDLPARCLITERNWAPGIRPTRCKLCPDASPASDVSGEAQTQEGGR